MNAYTYIYVHTYNFANALSMLAGGRARCDGDATRAAALGVGGLQRTVFRGSRWAGEKTGHLAKIMKLNRKTEKPWETEIESEIYVNLFQSACFVFFEGKFAEIAATSLEASFFQKLMPDEDSRTEAMQFALFAVWCHLWEFFDSVGW